MKFVHIADIHLGANPSVGKNQTKNRAREIWDSFERLIQVCEEEKADLLFICGDLFHRQPLMRELKEVNHLFSRLTATQVVMIVGNHDYLKKDSYYRSFEWEEHVHMLLDQNIDFIEFPQLKTAVYGHSYHTREITEKTYKHAYAEKRQPVEILMLHGGDDKHIPVQKEELLSLGYDYIAMGHVHKPQELVPGKAAYAGALEPIDNNDTGVHGYRIGEITANGCQTRFVPFATREYVHLSVDAERKMSGYALKEKVKREVERYGIQNIFKIKLTGFRDPEVLFDLANFDVYGNIVEMSDETKPAYDFEKLQKQNADNILGYLIDEWKDCDKNSIEYQALCEGVQALMETRRT
ncbi:MAG: exonuclease SbcCD subunit D [Dorea sp.]